MSDTPLFAPAMPDPAADAPASEPVAPVDAPVVADAPAPDAPAADPAVAPVDAPVQSRNASGQFVSASSPDAVPAPDVSTMTNPAPSPAPDAPPADSSAAPADAPSATPAAPATQFNSTPDVAPDPLAAELEQLKAQFAALQQERDAARAAYISLASSNGADQASIDAKADVQRLTQENASLKAELASVSAQSLTAYEARMLAAVERLAAAAPDPAAPPA